MQQLYPLKFSPILSDKIWGGAKLRDTLNKPTKSGRAGESWEISGVKGNLSVVSEGFLQGNNLEELIETYMGDLVGDKVFEKFGVSFPLLIKFIDANDNLSIQVHPNDELAAERHGSFGKTEMWYVLEAEPGAQLIVGFNQPVDKEKYLESLNNKQLTEMLNYEEVKEGDVFFMPAGRVHAIGRGILVAEIQQTSDITYRIYDFDRVDETGNPRELHTELALDAIDYAKVANYRTSYRTKKNQPTELANCQYFHTNIIELSGSLEKDYIAFDSFVIYMCVEGSFEINHKGSTTVCARGETVLLPAELKQIVLSTKNGAKLLEVYVP
ncbi:MAG: mannose-6-phosphate isomerase [Bacteroidales bacterium]|nr:mannose-6-phosphate isomerase [Bacteroidales bacterium]